MEKNIEIEFKTLLTKEQYEQMKQLFTEITPYSQINHYFDTNNQDLYRKREMLRVRFKNNKYDKSSIRHKSFRYIALVELLVTFVTCLALYFIYFRTIEDKNEMWIFH